MQNATRVRFYTRIVPTCGVDSRRSSYRVVIVLAPPRVNLWTGILFGGWGVTLLGGGAIQPIVHSKAGCLLHTTLPMDGEGDIWHTTGPNH